MAPILNVRSSYPVQADDTEDPIVLPQITYTAPDLGPPPLLLTSTRAGPFTSLPTQPLTASSTPSTTSPSSVAQPTSSTDSLFSTFSDSQSSTSLSPLPTSSTFPTLHPSHLRLPISHSTSSSPSPSDSLKAITTQSHHSLLPIVLLVCLAGLIIIGLIGSSLSWCLFSKTIKRRRLGLSRSDRDELELEYHSDEDADAESVSLPDEPIEKEKPHTEFGAAKVVLPVAPLNVHLKQSLDGHHSPDLWDWGRGSLTVRNSAPRDWSDEESLVGHLGTDVRPHSRRWKLK